MTRLLIYNGLLVLMVLCEMVSPWFMLIVAISMVLGFSETPPPASLLRTPDGFYPEHLCDTCTLHKRQTKHCCFDKHD